MDRLKTNKKNIPRIVQQELYTLNTPRSTEANPRADLTLDERQGLKTERKKKLKNSDIFIIKKSKK